VAFRCGLNDYRGGPGNILTIDYSGIFDERTRELIEEAVGGSIDPELTLPCNVFEFQRIKLVHISTIHDEESIDDGLKGMTPEHGAKPPSKDQQP